MKSLKMQMMAALTILSVSVFAQETAGKSDSSKHLTLYTCPMHDTVALKKPGNCSICGMKLQLSQKEQMKQQVIKNYSCPLHTEVVSNKPGNCSKCGASLALSSKEKMKPGYCCPMHANEVSEKQGKCPKCGMALIEKKDNHSNHKH